MHIKSRESLRGARNPNAALSKDDVLTIRRRYKEGVTQGELCRVYGVSISTIARIVNWHTWAWLTDEDSTLPGLDEPTPKLSPEAQAQLERDASASAERLKVLLAQGGPEPETARPFVYPRNPDGSLKD